MTKKIFYCFIILLCCVAQLRAQDGFTEHAKKYVEQYYALAIAEQRASGIPASITLGQGILETEAGTSELMTQANNHFGIKCKNNWQGPTFLHTDDAKDECFKKYADAAESFRDHSAHLIRNPRYAPLFKCSKTDYAAWAVGLKKCGYATNPQYAQRLIKIIEDFRLQEYTYTALDTSLINTYPALVDEKPGQEIAPQPVQKEYEKPAKDSTRALPAKRSKIKVSDVPVPAAAPDTLADAATDANPLWNMADSAREVMRHNQEQAQIHAAAASDTTKVTTVNGLKAFYAHKNEMLLEYAVKYSVRYPRLLELNDLADAPLPFDMYIYLEKKLSSGTHDKHIVAEGETLLMIAQAEGMQLKRIVAINSLTPGEEPEAGTVLDLQTAPGRKPLPKQTAAKAAAAKDNDGYKPTVYSSLAGGPDTASATVQSASYGMSFAGDDDDSDKSDTAPAGTGQASPHPHTAPAAAANTTFGGGQQQAREQAAQLPAKSPLRDDVQQPQLKKPATEKEYKKGDKYYIVKRGDTAYAIAKSNDITVAQLLKWNDTEPQDIKAGQTLRIKE